MSNLNKLIENDFVMANLDSEDQAKEIVDCYLQLVSEPDAYDLMKMLESKYGWTGSLENCLFLNDVLEVLGG